MASVKYSVAIVVLGVVGALGLSDYADYTVAKRVEGSQHLAERASFIGGWALGGGFDTCPSNTTSCESTTGKTGNLPGTCCPSSTKCVGQGLGLGIACCPNDSPSCGMAISTIPTCADPTWTLYNGIRKYFCCAPGQIGVFPHTGLNDLVGLCVPGDQNVAASDLAKPVSSLVPKTSTSAPSAATTGATAAATTVSSSTSVAASATAKSAGSVASSPLNGILGSAMGVLIVGIFL